MKTIAMCLLLISSARAERVVMEGKPSTMNSITVSSTSALVSVGTLTAAGYITSVSSINANQFFGPLTGDVLGNVTGNVSGSAGSTTGNAATATALAANPANCSAGQAPLGVDASGAVEGCYTTATDISGKLDANLFSSSATIVADPTGYIPAGRVPTLNQNTSGLAGTATALAANGANCSAGNYPLGVDASGAAESCTAAATVSTATVILNPAGYVPAGLVPTLNQDTSGNAGTATALAADPSDCTLPNVSLGVNASGTAQCSQPSNVTGNAATVTTNANLTGPVTSVGNATTIVGPVPAAAVDLSTVTTALALKAPINNPTFTGDAVFPSSVTASAFFGDGSQLTGVGTAGDLFYIFVSTPADVGITGSTYTYMVSQSVYTPSPRSNRVMSGLSSSASSPTELVVRVTEPGYPGHVTIPQGQVVFHIHAWASTPAGGTISLYGVEYIRHADGTEVAIATSNIRVLPTTEQDLELDSIIQTTTTLATDRLVHKVFVYRNGGSAATEVTISIDGTGAEGTTFAGVSFPASAVDVGNFVPYTGATTNLNLGAKTIAAGNLSGTNTGDQTNITGNAATATALAADPSDCGASEYATAIGANGNLTCSVPPAGAGETNTYTSSKTIQGALLVTGDISASSVTSTYGVSAGSFSATTDGDSTAPAYRGTDANSGMAFSAVTAGDINFVVNGALRASVVTGVGLCGGDGSGSGRPCMRSAASSAADPGFQWTTDGNTGVHLSGSNSQDLVAGGVSSLRHTVSDVAFFPETIGTSTITLAGDSAFRSVTATAYSSAPVVYTSSHNVSGNDFFEWFDKEGNRAMLYDGAGGVRGLRINPGTVDTSGTADLDLYGYANGGPILQFRRNDSSVSAKNSLMYIAVRDHDSSTGGSTEKASYRVIAGDTVWNSNTPMEQWHTWGLTRRPDAQADYMVLTSTGLLVVGYPGVVSESQSSCSTCTLQVISPAGYGVDIVGNLTVTGALELASTIKIAGGSPGASKVLTSDANGLASWETPTGGTAWSVQSSSWAMTTGGSFAGADFACVTGSTITLTTAGNNVEIIAKGNGTNASTATNIVGVMVDGTQLASMQVTATGGNAMHYGLYHKHKPSAGSHSYCLWAQKSAGTFTFYGEGWGRSTNMFIREVNETTP